MRGVQVGEPCGGANWGDMSECRLGYHEGVQVGVLPA